MTTTKKTPKNRPVIDWNRTALLPLSMLYRMMAQASPLNFSVYNSGYYIAFRSMLTASDSYGDDSGLSVCRYALGNWSSARTAKGVGPWYVFEVNDKLLPGEGLPVPCDPCYFVREMIKRHIELAEAQQAEK